jgi:hypothetical protein
VFSHQNIVGVSLFSHDSYFTARLVLFANFSEEGTVEMRRYPNSVMMCSLQKEFHFISDVEVFMALRYIATN